MGYFALVHRAESAEQAYTIIKIARAAPAPDQLPLVVGQRANNGNVGCFG